MHKIEVGNAAVGLRQGVAASQ